MYFQRFSRIRRTRHRAQAALAPMARVVVDFLLHPLAPRIPRNPRRWVFGHEYGEFAGNPRFFYLWLLGREDVEPWWITGSLRTWRRLRRHGCPVALRWSPKGMYLTMTAGVVFFAHRTSDVNASLVRGALLVNLWHGVGLKAIQLGWGQGNTVQRRAKATTPIKRATYRTFLTDPDIVVTTSPFMRTHFARQFGFGPDRCPILGYPRLDGASDEKLAAKSRQFDEPIGFALRPSGIDEAYIYLPTWRDSSRPFLDRAFPNLPRLQAVLAERNAVLYVKLHPATRDALPAGFDRIVPWPPEVDLYNYLGDFDGLITDYSSILYDFLALGGRGAVIYAFDLDEYLARDHALVYPFEDNVAGIWARSFDDLCQLLAGGVREAGFDDSKAEAIRRKFWDSGGATASSRIYDYIRARMKISG